MSELCDQFQRNRLALSELAELDYKPDDWNKEETDGVEHEADCAQQDVVCTPMRNEGDTRRLSKIREENSKASDRESGQVAL